MEREKTRFDILKKIEYERKRRDWSEYTLSQKSGVTQSTISTWYRKQLQPSVASLEKICDGLGITLSEFFSEYDTNEKVALSNEQVDLLTLWNKLTKNQKIAVTNMLETFM